MSMMITIKSDGPILKILIGGNQWPKASNVAEESKLRSGNDKWNNREEINGVISSPMKNDDIDDGVVSGKIIFDSLMLWNDIICQWRDNDIMIINEYVSSHENIDINDRYYYWKCYHW